MFRVLYGCFKPSEWVALRTEQTGCRTGASRSFGVEFSMNLQRGTGPLPISRSNRDEAKPVEHPRSQVPPLVFSGVVAETSGDVPGDSLRGPLVSTRVCHR